VWGRLAEDRAQRIFPVLRDWVAAEADDKPKGRGESEQQQQQGRCFFKSTTAGANSFRDRYFETELHTIRPHALKAGCGYLDFAYLTQDFGALDYESSLKDPRAERRSVFVDQVRAAVLFLWVDDPLLKPSWLTRARTVHSPVQVHLQPWVYEELNQVLLNVLCNGG
jgi:hypothetical protein